MASSVTGDSPEAVAYALLEKIQASIPKTLTTDSRKWILSTYAECLVIARGGARD